jgi:hypothetical protein
VGRQGDLTARGIESFSWDYEDRRVSATVSSVTTTFAYRGDGLRNSKTTCRNTVRVDSTMVRCRRGRLLTRAALIRGLMVERNDQAEA